LGTEPGNSATPLSIPLACSPHCTIRILAAGDFLFIRTGDTTEDGNECRAAADTMFCSPRSFWTDLIIDRK
jgi:hypothetical protein